MSSGQKWSPPRFGLASDNACRITLYLWDLTDLEPWQKTGVGIALANDGFSFVKLGTQISPWTPSLGTTP